MTSVLKGYYGTVILKSPHVEQNGNSVFLSLVGGGNGIPDRALVLQVMAPSCFQVCLSIRSQCGWKEVAQSDDAEISFDLKVEVGGKSQRAPLFPLMFQLFNKTSIGMTLLSEVAIPVRAITKILKKSLHAALVPYSYNSPSRPISTSLPSLPSFNYHTIPTAEDSGEEDDYDTLPSSPAQENTDLHDDVMHPDIDSGGGTPLVGRKHGLSPASASVAHDTLESTPSCSRNSYVCLPVPKKMCVAIPPSIVDDDLQGKRASSSPYYMSLYPAHSVPGPPNPHQLVKAACPSSPESALRPPLALLSAFAAQQMHNRDWEEPSPAHTRPWVYQRPTVHSHHHPTSLPFFPLSHKYTSISCEVPRSPFHPLVLTSSHPAPVPYKPVVDPDTRIAQGAKVGDTQETQGRSTT
eukprot:TRINITY_DN10598_c0_g1_i4.p1 TRINITY_DN10598_c0_g1~~TRINITY_DN10598_c0_g1_i4.p1  ORF type:complete len:408 (+),score=55.20 TRINITY_DN10598_c0_g1_i4:119-1342(+)